MTTQSRFDSQLDSDRIYANLLKAGNTWADADSAASLLEESRKSVLASIIQDLEGSQAAKESGALASETYQEHVQQMVEARRVANRARVAYDAVRVLAELRRSEESTRRAEASIR